MDRETKEMLKTVAIFDGIILFLTIGISMILFKNYRLVIIIGLVLAIMNFMLNAIVTNYTFAMTGKKAIYILGSVVRIIITVTIAVIICNSIHNFVAFLIGYSLHYLAVILYGITRKNKKGCD